MWESGAIVQYIIEQYDTKHVLSYNSLKEKHHCNQWLAFQISGQGPYFGQAAWFTFLHPEEIPSAIERYTNEMRRVLSVLDGALEGKQWLVGNKMTYADLAFAPWNARVDTFFFCKPEEKFKDFPNVHAWHERMTNRPAWKTVMDKRLQLVEEKGMGPNGLPKGINTPQEFRAMMKAMAEKTAQE